MLNYMDSVLLSGQFKYEGIQAFTPIIWVVDVKNVKLSNMRGVYRVGADSPPDLAKDRSVGCRLPFILERCRENDHSSSGNRISTFRRFNMGADYF